MQRKVIYNAAFVLVVALHIIGALDFVEARLSDMRFSLVKRPPTQDLVVVTIDPPSLAELEVWPWPRGYHAQVLDRLVDAGAMQVAFDVDFGATTSPAEDKLFEEAAERAGIRLILAMFKQRVASDHGSIIMTSRPKTEFSENARLASINVVPDPDGIVRQMPIEAYTQGTMTPSLATVLAGRQAQSNTGQLVDFGIELSEIPMVSFADVLLDRVDMSIFEGKSVLVGATAAQLHDQIPVARYVSISGALLHALAYESLVQQRVLARHGPPITLVLGALFMLLFTDRMHKWSRSRCIIAIISAPSALILLSILAQNYLAWSIEVAPTILLMAIIMTLATLNQVYAQSIDLLFQRRSVAQTRSIMDSVVENSFDGIATFDDDGRLKSANAAFLAMYNTDIDTVHDRHLDRFVELPGETEDAHNGDHAFGQNEGQGLRPDGSQFPIDFAVSRAISEDYSGIVVTVRDTTERVRRQQELEYQALHDSLTGLPNRVLLDDRIEQAVAACNRDNGKFALLVLDLDRFKEVNDTLGHKVGDTVLIEVASRLVEPLREIDTIARLGGDEFAIVLPDIPNADHTHQITERLVEAMRRPIRVSDLDLEVGISIGIAVYPDHGTEGHKLFQCADIAMYQAKQSLSSVEFYDEVADRSSVRHLTMSGELRTAIDRNDLRLAYQPQIDLNTRRITGLEALMRWNHAEMGPIPPDEFVVQAERTGLISDLTFWSIEASLSDLARIRKANPSIDIAINLSARMLHDQTLFNFIEHQLRRFHLPPSAITLEITESTLMANPDVALALLEQMSTMGLQFSIDDFGTGYSSLAYLKRLSVHELKIDKSFVLNMIDDDADAAIVRSTVDLAHHLGLRVVAEGIETERHIEMLADLHCDLGQGFHIARPMPADDLIEWLGKADQRLSRRGPGKTITVAPDAPSSGLTH